MFRRDDARFHPLHTPPPFSQLLPAISSNTVKMLIGPKLPRATKQQLFVT